MKYATMLRYAIKIVLVIHTSQYVDLALLPLDYSTVTITFTYPVFIGSECSCQFPRSLFSLGIPYFWAG